MIALLMNFALMGVILTGLLKAYYDVPFLNENPKTSGTIGVMILLVILWIFPKIIGFVIKLAAFACIIYFICHTMGWDLSFLKSSKDETVKVLEQIGDNIGDKLEKLKETAQKNQTFDAKVTTAATGYSLQIGDETVQLYGIDAPDNAQTCKNSVGGEYNCGVISAQALQAMVENQDVHCQIKGKNSYGQLVAACAVDGNDLGTMMVRSGWAVADREISNAYVADEKIAHDRKVGMWDGKFQAPWKWRENNSDAPKKSNSLANVTPFQKIIDFFTK